MNLDLTEEEFEKLSLADMNEINLRLAKRLNESVKRWNKMDKSVASIIRTRYGESPFSYKKAERKRDAINKHNKALNYIKKGFSSRKAYEKKKAERDRILAENTDLAFMSDADKSELGNFFSIMYDKLKLDAEIFNYRAVCNLFIDYRMTENEKKSMDEFIVDSWAEFEKNNDRYSSRMEHDKNVAKFMKQYDDLTKIRSHYGID